MENWIEYGCSTGRQCPCAEAALECTTEGCCAGRLFWRDPMTAAESYRAALREKEEEAKSEIDEELVAALVGLGYSTKEAKEKARSAPETLDLEGRVKFVLKGEE